MAMIYVDGKGLSPSSYSVGIQDISSADSGRTDDGVMHKNVVATKRTISLSFNGKRPGELQEILSLFKPTYVNIQYPDPRDGTRTGTFYTGDIEANVFSWISGREYYETTSFNVIER